MISVRLLLKTTMSIILTHPSSHTLLAVNTGRVSTPCSITTGPVSEMVHRAESMEQPYVLHNKTTPR